MIKEFVKRQDRVLALQWDGTQERFKEMRSLIVGCVPRVNFQKARPPLRLPQPNGTELYAHIGDWVIRDDAGKMQVLAGPMFAMRYTPVEDEAVPRKETVKVELKTEPASVPEMPAPADVSNENYSDKYTFGTDKTSGSAFQSETPVPPTDDTPAPAPAPAQPRRGRPPKGGK